VKRRSDAPLTILVIGISAVVMLGVGVIKYTGQTPILQLPPAIKQRWGYEDVVARFKRGVPPWVEVELPAAATTDRLRMAEVGAFALDRYRTLAPTTQVESVVVRVKDRPEIAPVTMTLMLASQLAAAQADPAARPSRVQAAIDSLDRSLGKGEVHDVEVQVLGLSTSGVDLRVTGKSRKAEAADQIAAAVTSISWVGRVEVEVEGAKGPTTCVGGRDVPRRRR
jgi:hypothetical protein